MNIKNIVFLKQKNRVGNKDNDIINIEIEKKDNLYTLYIGVDSSIFILCELKPILSDEYPCVLRKT